MKKIVAVIAIHGREQITLKTVLRLKQQTYPLTHVVLIGDTPKEQKLAEITGSIFVRYPNQPLGAKWQAGMDFARQLDPDVILILGSDDWLSDNWCARMMQEIDAGYDLVGKQQIFFLHVGPEGKKLIRWDGYKDNKEREGEPIGAGRLISRKLLDRLNWSWFAPKLLGGLDKFSYLRAVANGGTVKLVTDESAYVVDIKSPFWENIWSFESIMPASVVINDTDSWLDTHFPGARSFFDIVRERYVRGKLMENQGSPQVLTHSV
jgi:glycosyltransferase involved in cell wall biosynthesis